LQNVHRKSFRDRYNMCVGVRPIMRILNSMMSYEKFRPEWNSYLDSVRWAMQLSAAWYHPSFHAFAEWLCDMDSYSELDSTEIVERAGGQANVLNHLGRRYEGAVLFCDDVTECPGFNEMAYVRSLRGK